MAHMTMVTRREYLKRIKIRYLKASRKEKVKLLDETVKTTGLDRKYATTLFSVATSLEPRIGDQRKRRRPIYDNEVVYYLKKMWDILDGPCGQRMVGSIPGTLEALLRHGEFNLSSGIQAKLCRMSPSTIDRRLRRWKASRLRRLHGTTKPGSLLAKHIPIELSRWNETKLGYSEIDLVSHNGGDPEGECAYTLTDTDLASGWTEEEAFLGKSERRVTYGLAAIDKRRPFDRKGIDSDSGGEFINWHLLGFCRDQDIAFTRGRPNHKNDNAHVEEKNWTHVRKLVGYHRYDTVRQVALMNDLYRNEWRLYENFFQATLKLVEKKRIGGHLHRTYGIPKTPHQRIMESSEVAPKVKEQLARQFRSLNPAALKRQIERKLHALLRTVRNRRQRTEHNDLFG